MAPTRRRYLVAATGAFALAGCRSASDETNTPTDGTGNGGGAPDTSTGNGRGATTVGVREHEAFGGILVDGEGLTLYMFDSDTRESGASTCSGGCLDAWPPLTTTGETGTGDGVAAELTTFDRDDGTTQVAANGWPLYYYVSDSSPGDVTGQGVNEVWWVLDPAGAPIRSTGGTATETAGDSGLGY